MKNRETLSNIEDFEDFLQSTEVKVNMPKQIFSFFISFFISFGNVCGQASPFGISYCAASSKETSFSTSIGSLLGYLFSGNGYNMKYIIAVLLIATFKWLFENIKYISTGSIAFFSTIASSFIFMVIAGEFVFYNILLILSESAMAAGAAFFFSKSQKYLQNKIYYKGLSNSELAVILISFIIVIMPLIPINVFGISIGKVIAIYVILFVAQNMGSANASIVGMIIGGVLLLNNSETNGYVILSYGIGGFLAGLIKKYGNIGVASTFIIVKGIASILAATINQEEGYGYILELMISTLIFILTSNFIKNKIPFIQEDNIDILSCDNAKNLMLLKLSFASKALHDIAKTTDKLSEKIYKNSQPTINEVYSKCVANVCGYCDLKMFCWNTNYNDTINNFNDMTYILNKNSRVTKSEMPVFFQKKCKKPDEVITTINQNYNKFIANKGAERKIMEIRGVVTDQFDGLSIMLKELAEDFCNISQFDKKTSIKAKKVFTSLGLNVYAITSFIDKYGRSTIEASTALINNIDEVSNIIAMELSQICEKTFGAPIFSKIENGMKITIIEKANFDIDFGVVQFSCNNSKNCGDCYDYFVDSKGRGYMVLSDGMGTGKQAYMDGAMTTRLFSRLIKCGFEFEAALKMVNSALLIKSSEESLATVDVACIDLYTGQTDIYKVGSAPTFVKKSNKAVEIGCSTLPAGILRGVSFNKKTISLKNQDIIIMVSDGVTDNEYQWIYNEIKSFRYNIDAKEFARKIALESKFRKKSGHDDDVTVMVGIISKGV